MAVGFKVKCERVVQFRKWAILVIEQFTIRRFVMDDEYLKNNGSILTKRGMNDAAILSGFPVLTAEDLANAWACARANGRQIDRENSENGDVA